MSELVAAQSLNSTSSTIIAPTFQEVTLLADQESQTAQIEVTNQNNQVQTFDLFAIGVNQIDNQGNVILADKPLSNAENPISEFVTFPESTIEILPNQKKAIAFTVNNSQNLTPGGNYVVIMLRAQPIDSQLTTNQSVLPAISSFVLIRKLGGERYNLSLTEMEGGDRQLWWQLPKSIQLVFENQGNIHTTPRGQITISDIFGRTVVEGTINESSQFVFPRTQKEVPIQLRQIRPTWPIMLYNVTAQGRSDPGDSTFTRQSYSVFLSHTAGLFIASLIVVTSVGYLIVKKIIKQKHAIKAT